MAISKDALELPISHRKFLSPCSTPLPPLSCIAALYALLSLIDATLVGTQAEATDSIFVLPWWWYVVHHC